MQFIFLTECEQSYHIESAETVMEALKQYVAYYACGDNKAFTILCDSEKMELVELIRYANHHLLCNHNAINAIYALGEMYAEVKT